MSNCSICCFKGNSIAFPLEQSTIKPKEILFSENQNLKGIYCIKKGVCKISKLNPNGKDQIIHLLNKNALLGIRSVLSDEVTNLKAEALTEMQACFIARESLFEQLRKNNDFSLYLLKKLADHLKITDNKIVLMGQKKLEERLAFLLLYFRQ